LSGPRGLAVDGFGNLFIASSENALVLEVPALVRSASWYGLNAHTVWRWMRPGRVHRGLRKQLSGRGLSRRTAVDAELRTEHSNWVAATAPRCLCGGLRQCPCCRSSAFGARHSALPHRCQFDQHGQPADCHRTNIGNQALNLTGVSFPVDFPEGTGEELCSTSVSLIPGQGAICR